MYILNTRFARWVLALLMALQALLSFFGLLLPLSYRLGLTGMTAMLGQFMQGADYRRFIPLLEAMPVGLLGLSAISGVLYLAAAWLLLRQQATSFLAFAAALAIALVRWSIVTRIPADQPGYPSPAAQLVLPLLMMVALWQMLRQRTTAASAARGLVLRSPVL